MNLPVKILLRKLELLGFEAVSICAQALEQFVLNVADFKQLRHLMVG